MRTCSVGDQGKCTDISMSPVMLHDMTLRIVDHDFSYLPSVHVRTDSADKPNHRPCCNEHSSQNSKYPHLDTSKGSAREYISGQYDHDGCQYEHTNGNIWSNPVDWEFLTFFHIVLNK